MAYQSKGIYVSLEPITMARPQPIRQSFDNHGQFGGSFNRWHMARFYDHVHVSFSTDKRCTSPLSSLITSETFTASPNEDFGFFFPPFRYRTTTRPWLFK
ncbi:hypothetical protein CC2G_002427 [Coprinopsis cinerea AmutBmut pab1-1]|nr:hypothetical protein CC2G_002427 [Coprinopsis cinerea AmutBmut pab1-1]